MANIKNSLKISNKILKIKKNFFPIFLFINEKAKNKKYIYLYKYKVL